MTELSDYKRMVEKPMRDAWAEERARLIARAEAAELRAKKAEEERVLGASAWPYCFYDGHQPEHRLRTLADLFEQPVDGKLTGRVSIGDPARAAGDIRDLVARLQASEAALQRAQEALRRIDDLCPATQEWSVAHQMADIAQAALSTLSQGEGKE